jgi:hypothetical protein
MVERAAAGRSDTDSRARMAWQECVILRRSRIPEPTLTAERCFLSVCYPKAIVDFKPDVWTIGWHRGSLP